MTTVAKGPTSDPENRRSRCGAADDGNHTDDEPTAQARRAVENIAINNWGDVAPLLRLRAVSNREESARSRPVGPGLWLELAVAIPNPADATDTGFIVTPTMENLAAWDRPAESVWRVAVGNTRAQTPPVTAVRHHSHHSHLFIVRLAAGPPWTTGALADVGYFVRRWWPDAVGWGRASSRPDGTTGTRTGRPADITPSAWACALSPTGLAVVEPAAPTASPAGVVSAAMPSNGEAAARDLLLSLARCGPNPLPSIVVPVRQGYL